MSFEVSPADLATRLESANPPCLLDVRRPEEHAIAALDGAKLIPLAELPARLGEIADWNDREVVVLCHHGVRSLRAVRLLREAGFPDVLSLAGGIERWALEIDPKTPRY